MKPYDPQKPLISLHIPKCAGQSLRQQLRAWFQDRFFTHYFQKHEAPPERQDLPAGSCLHGHFNARLGFGAAQYYPEVDQFITFLRHPLEREVSNYFFWKRKGRANKIRRGELTPGDPVFDFRDIHHYFEVRRRFNASDYLPFALTEENCAATVEEGFISVGIVEDFNASLALLGRRLGFAPAPAAHLNDSPRDEALDEAEKRRYAADNPVDYAFYAAALACHRRSVAELQP